MSHELDDTLLWRSRRLAQIAKGLAGDGNPRRIRSIEADLRALIKQLEERARDLGRRIEAIARQKKAASAYSRCFNLGRR
jgi:hypothetical protein